MDLVAFLARVALALVFAVAGFTKLRDRDGTARGIRDFGVPERFTGVGAVVLPLAELLVAAALLPTQTAQAGAIAGLVLLGSFSAAIVANLSRGRRPDCHCFGELYSAPIGPRTLLRNGMFAALAAVVLYVGPGAGPAEAAAQLGQPGSIRAAVAVLVVAAVALVAVAGAITLALLRQQGRVLVRLDELEVRSTTLSHPSVVGGREPSVDTSSGLPHGTPAPSFSLDGLRGKHVSLDSLREAGKPIALIFADPRCRPCEALMPRISQWERDGTDVTFAVVSRGTIDENTRYAAKHALPDIAVQENGEVAAMYRTVATPSAVLITADGSIAGTAVGEAAITAMITRAGADGGSSRSPHARHRHPGPPALHDRAGDVPLRGNA